MHTQKIEQIGQQFVETVSKSNVHFQKQYSITIFLRPKVHKSICCYVDYLKCSMDILKCISTIKKKECSE